MSSSAPGDDPAGHLPANSLEQTECIDNASVHGLIPVMPDSVATDAERDAYWREHVYLGDSQLQFTFRAVVLGGLFGGVMAITNLYIVLKTGWGIGLGIIATLGTYAGMNALCRLFPKIPGFTMLENNAMGSTAVSAGSSTGMTLVGCFGGLLLVNETGTNPDWIPVTSVVFLTALLGVFLAIPQKRQLVNEGKLTFPSPTAGAVMLKGLYAKGAEGLQQARMLFLSLSISATFGFFRVWADLAKTAHDIGRPNALFDFLGRFTIPGEIPLTGFLNPMAKRNLTLNGLAFEPSLLLTSVGLIVGMRVSLSMFLAGVLLYFGFAPMMHLADLEMMKLLAATPEKLAAFKPAMELHDNVISPTKWGLWGGTALMVTASFVTLGLQWRTIARSFSGILPKNKTHVAVSDPVEDLEVPMSWMFGAIPVSIALIIALWMGFGIHPLLGLLAVFVSFAVSIVCCRSCGEADINPIGAMGKITQLIFALLPGAVGNIVVNLVVAGSTAAASGDMMGDFKSSHLIGANPRKVWMAQLIGIFFGIVFVVPAWYLLIPNKAKLLEYPAVPAKLWSAVAKLLTDKDPTFFYGAIPLMIVCAVIGALIPLLSHYAPKLVRWMPSTMGLGLGIMLPFSNSLSFMIGALIMRIWEKGHKKSAAAIALTVASGLMSGQAVVEAFTQLGITAAHLGFDKHWW
jgi:OPT family oligopeptide transporter